MPRLKLKRIQSCFAAFSFCFITIQPAVAQSLLSADDYIAIQQLVNKLNFALDYCTNDGQDFADLFTKDGQYIIDQGGGNTSIRTHDQLAALAGGPSCDSRRSAPSSYILHLSESLVIEPDADGARGMSYAIYPANHGNYLNQETVGQLGIYHDIYVKKADGWRIKSRRHEMNPVIGGIHL
jgi:hypothetical protein